MKKLIIIIWTIIIISACKTTYNSTFYDDVYYTPNSISNNNIKNYDSIQYQQKLTNEYEIIEYVDNYYIDYDYTSRINRFYRTNLRFGYYDFYYCWLSHPFIYNCGLSISYFSTGFGFGWGNLYYNPWNYNWYNIYPYYGYWYYPYYNGLYRSGYNTGYYYGFNNSTYNDYENIYYGPRISSSSVISSTNRSSRITENKTEINSRGSRSSINLLENNNQRKRNYIKPQISDNKSLNINRDINQSKNIKRDSDNSRNVIKPNRTQDIRPNIRTNDNSRNVIKPNRTQDIRPNRDITNPTKSLDINKSPSSRNSSSGTRIKRN